MLLSFQRQGRRRNTTFGVDFQEQVEHYHSAIPPIISKCLKEVERRGINVKVCIKFLFSLQLADLRHCLSNYVGAIIFSDLSLFCDNEQTSKTVPVNYFDSSRGQHL